MRIALLAGDGIGPEVTESAVTVLKTIADFYEFELEFTESSIGGAAITDFGDPFPDETRDACLASDAVLLGAVGDPSFDDLVPAFRPEKGLLRLREALGGYANLRPARAIPALLGNSPLRREVIEGTDLLIVRELLGGLYFGEPRGFEDAGLSAFNTLRYSKSEIERVARIAFQLAGERRNRLASVDKANVLETSRLWRSTVEEIATEYPNVEVEHLYVDACAMHLVTSPSRFDVILTENMFGDILSDEASVLSGSLGVLASATIGGSVDLYEPVHGSAPDIAGRSVANPIGAIQSAAMLLRHTAKNEVAASAIERAIESVLAEGARTADILETGEPVSTSEMTSRICKSALEHAGVTHAFHAV